MPLTWDLAGEKKTWMRWLNISHFGGLAGACTMKVWFENMLK